MSKHDARPGAEPPHKTQRKLEALDVLRVVAAVAVVAEHERTLFFKDYADVAHSPLRALFYTVTGLGHEAVMVFFVLSGFWVGGSVVRQVSSGRFSGVNYIVQRLSRLWVVLLPGLLLTAACGIALLSAWPDSDVTRGSSAYHDVATRHLTESLSPQDFLGNVAFLQTIATHAYGSNGPLWSLAYEWWFYVAFPLLVLAVFKRSLRAALGASLLLLLGALVAPHILKYFPMWLLGALLALVEGDIRRLWSQLRPASLMAFRLSTGALLVGALAVSRSHHFSLIVTDAGVAFATTLLVAGFLHSPGEHSGPIVRVRDGIAGYAQSAYTLYVVHTPLLAVAGAALIPLSKDRSEPAPASVAVFVVGLILCIAVGYAAAALTEHRTESVRRAVHTRLGPGLARRSGDAQQQISSAG